MSLLFPDLSFGFALTFCSLLWSLIYKALFVSEVAVQFRVIQRNMQMAWTFQTKFLQLNSWVSSVPGHWAVNFQTLCATSLTLHLSTVPRSGTKSGFSPLLLELLFNQAFAISTAVICKALQCMWLFQTVHSKPILAVTKCSELATTFLLLFGSGLIFSY